LLGIANINNGNIDIFNSPDSSNSFVEDQAEELQDALAPFF